MPGASDTVVGSGFQIGPGAHLYTNTPGTVKLVLRQAAYDTCMLTTGHPTPNQCEASAEKLQTS